MTTTEAPGADLPLQQLDRVVIRFAGDSGDGMQITGNQFTHTSALFGNDLATLPDFPPRSARQPGRGPGCRASSCSSARRTSTPRGRARRAGRHEPGRAGGQHQGAQGRRHGHRQHRQLQGRRPEEGQARGEPARGRDPRGLSRHRGRHQRTRARGPRGLAALHEGEVALQELLHPRPHVLALQPAHGADHRVARAEVRQEARHRRRQRARAEGGLQRRRHPRGTSRASTRSPRPPSSRPARTAT